MRTIKGQASGTFSPVIGEATTTGKPFYARSNAVLVTSSLDMSALGYAGCITSGKRGTLLHPDTIFHTYNLDIINNGDIVYLSNDGTVTILWENNSNQNALCLTEACNCNCIMCPQPPKKHSKYHIDIAEKILNLLKRKVVPFICITGGEPTLIKDDFLHLLNRCVKEHPEAIINILTNGKNFSDISFAREVTSIATSNTVFCISLHSEIEQIHDYLVGIKGSFKNTQFGIYNLAKLGAYIEIRHVITKINYKRLQSFADHMYSYFPFCCHYALMGLELCGYAADNAQQISIYPHEYRDELAQAVLSLHRRDLPVSIYNIPLCLCDPRIRSFARQSISSWKNQYTPQCSRCAKKRDCAGFFSTSKSLPLEHIQPFMEE